MPYASSVMGGTLKIIFLDFDGVLNSTQSAIYHVRKRTQYDTIFIGDWCPIAFSNLKRLLEATPDARIVVSSSWRHGRTLEQLREILMAEGVDPSRIIGATPSSSVRGEQRGWEIQDWLDAHPEVKDYVIIDDDADMLPHQQEHFVQTDGHIGLTIHDACRAYGILGHVGISLRMNFYDDY